VGGYGVIAGNCHLAWLGGLGVVVAWYGFLLHGCDRLLAAREAERVLPIFENQRPGDRRPRQAIEAIRAWATGKRELGMAEVRRLSLGAHAAAREARSDEARFVARAAGHAVATWHVPTHAMGAPMYACKAIMASLARQGLRADVGKRRSRHRPG